MRLTIARSGAAQPRLEWNLRGERVRFHRVELRREQRSVCAANTERDKRPGIAEDCRAEVRRDLIGKLMTEAKMRAIFAHLRHERREGVCTKRLELVDMGEI